MRVPTFAFSIVRVCFVNHYDLDQQRGGKLWGGV
jgi:hypothetical protein